MKNFGGRGWGVVWVGVGSCGVMGRSQQGKDHYVVVTVVVRMTCVTMNFFEQVNFISTFACIHEESRHG